MNAHATERGISLVEVLVSLVIVSTGVLATVALQLVVKRNHVEAGQRSLAAGIARDLAEELRAGAEADPAAQDARALQQALEGGLALPAACIDGSAGVYRITLAWRGALAQPDDDTVACGRDPQPDGGSVYSRAGADNLFRRTLTLPLTVLAPRQP